MEIEDFSLDIGGLMAGYFGLMVIEFATSW